MDHIKDHVRKLANAERVDQENPTPVGKPNQKFTLQRANKYITQKS